MSTGLCVWRENGRKNLSRLAFCTRISSSVMNVNLNAFILFSRGGWGRETGAELKTVMLAAILQRQIAFIFAPNWLLLNFKLILVFYEIIILLYFLHFVVAIFSLLFFFAIKYFHLTCWGCHVHKHKIVSFCFYLQKCVLQLSFNVTCMRLVHLIEKLLFLIDIKFTSHTALLLKAMKSTESHRLDIVTVLWYVLAVGRCWNGENVLIETVSIILKRKK